MKWAIKYHRVSPRCAVCSSFKIWFHQSYTNQLFEMSGAEELLLPQQQFYHYDFENAMCTRYINDGEREREKCGTFYTTNKDF